MHRVFLARVPRTHAICFSLRSAATAPLGKTKFRAKVTGKDTAQADAEALKEELARKESASGKKKPVNHLRLTTMCIVCGVAGYYAGNFASIDESQVGPPFERNAVERELRRAFEFRPDLAPLVIRLAFAYSVRVGVEKAEADGAADVSMLRELYATCTGGNPCGALEDPNDSLEDAYRLLETIRRQQRNITLSDTITLSAVYAVQFLRGPRVRWLWGRSDGRYTSATRWGLEPSGTEPPPKRDNTVPPSVMDYFSMFGVTLEEAVALMGIHAVGTAHSDASGVSGFRCPTHFRLDNSYFKQLTSTSFKRVNAGSEGEFDYYVTSKGEGKHKYFVMFDHDVRLVGKNATAKAEAKLKSKERQKLDAEVARIVKLFADDNAVFRKRFASGFSKVLDVGYGGDELREYKSQVLGKVSPTKEASEDV